MDASTIGNLSVAAVIGMYVAIIGIWTRKSRSSSREVDHRKADDSVSGFGRKRLPRGDPHQWADRLEDWFARISWHVRFLYFGFVSLALIVVIHIFYAH